ncbi:hypothetical protein [Lactiplantibacillus daowaiensis]|uniref:Uncharacterized protein n=1 Tax=Lactiplantibacillus daowaiensis TaxID=2559918 RepID=A0ABW1RX12_9LACO|nr:hypothetical protein [Lactiplantibacillus daowaiensis]
MKEFGVVLIDEAKFKKYDCHFVATTPASLFELVFEHVSKVLKECPDNKDKIYLLYQGTLMKIA